jgi:hypothetical protein
MFGRINSVLLTIVILLWVGCKRSEKELGQSKRSNEALPPEQSDGLDMRRITAYDLLITNEADRRAFQEFFGPITNIDMMVEFRVEQLDRSVDSKVLQQWAEKTLSNAGTNKHKAKLWMGVTIEAGQLPKDLVVLGNPVAAAVVRDGSSPPHVRVAWRSLDSFWGLAIGDTNFDLIEPELIVRQWRPGILVWHTR